MKKIICIVGLALACTGLWAQPETTKIIHGPYLQNVGAHEATIVWEANCKSVGWVELAPMDGSHFYEQARPKFWDSNIGLKAESTLHSVRLIDLKPGTTYRYKVYAQEVLSHIDRRVHYGDMGVSYTKNELTFTTLDDTKSETSFVVLNDIHQRTELLEPLLKAADYKNLDMVIYNGDMMSKFHSADELFNCIMDESCRLFASEKCFYYLRGNHETREELAPYFKDYFCPKIPNLYFTVRQGPLFIIFLDTGEDKPDSDLEYSGIVDYDHYRTEQAYWLKSVVASEEFKTAKFRVVVQHMPPVIKEREKPWHGMIELTEKFVPILEEAGIDLMIAAHIHRFVYNDTEYKFPVLTNSPFSALIGKTEGDKLHIQIHEQDGTVSFDKEF